MPSFSKVFEALEDNRREILVESNHALDVIKTLRTGSLEDFESKDEMIEEIENSIRTILNIVSK